MLSWKMQIIAVYGQTDWAFESNSNQTPAYQSLFEFETNFFNKSNTPLL